MENKLNSESFLEKINLFGLKSLVISGAKKDKLKNVVRIIVLDYSIWIILFGIVMILSSLTSRFLTTVNLMNILLHSSILGVVVIGESICLLSGKFDLSVGSTVGLSGALAAWLMVTGQPAASGWALHPIPAILIVLLVGIGIGLFNGFFIAKVGMNPLLTTLASMIFLRGMALIVTSGESLYNFPPSYQFLGGGTIGPVPTAVVIMLALYIIFHFILNCKKIGRHIYIVGGNPEAARACGISVEKVVMLAFMMSGFLAAVGGILLSSRLNSAQTISGSGMELDAIAASVIGGISLQGGRGILLNTIAGVLVIESIRTGLVLLDVPAFWIRCTMGFVIFLAILMDTLKVKLK
ncbi:ABC transporter permease [Candidatus Aerophobetes bacterium]|uniref:Ribose ABC transporter permease n=1 Tax=Aerophobetes bacterium TaxID=2030807 RepID=A0A662DKC1_UNCAE|nr:ABC transporter permease [Candidatus Aerophobetes bacterium]RLE15328.1 MAG: ribose ABC transporter permease [Candidatus Aerophobetes bacterium]